MSCHHSFQGVPKASLRRNWRSRCPDALKSGVKRRWRPKKTLKRGAVAAGRRKSSDGGSESGFGDLRFGPESPSSPLIRGGSSSSRSGGGGWDRRRGGGGSRGKGGGGGSRGRGGDDGAGAGAGEGVAATEQQRPLSIPDGLKWRLREWR
jgi:hypothetical protein